MNETSKALHRRLRDPLFHQLLRGDALDVGAGADGLSAQRYWWPRLTSVRDWDLPDGDAQELPGVERESFDVVHSSHCLEHLRDPEVALLRWWEVLRTGGHLVVMVPDWELYEQGCWPSTYNGDHRHSFTTRETESRSHRSDPHADAHSAIYAVTTLLSRLWHGRILRLSRLEETFNPQLPRVDQTRRQSESAIEFVVRKEAR